MALLDTIIGHNQQVTHLQRAIGKAGLASTWLFVGHSGIGKRLVAKAIAQTLICEQPERQQDLVKACGQCPSCRRVSLEQNENLLIVSPQGTQLKIENAREVIRFLSLQGLGRARVVIIDGAHKMTAQAANALLKSLEEPPEGTYFFLLGPSAFSFLATIRSRSQILRFSPLTESELRKITGADGWVLASSRGSIEMLEELRQPETADLRQVSLKAWELFIHRSHRLAFESIKDSVKDKGQSLLVTRLWQQLLRDVWLCKEGVGEWIHRDHQALIEELSKFDHEVLEYLAEGAIDLEADINGNLDRSLSFENFFYQADRVIAQSQ